MDNQQNLTKNASSENEITFSKGAEVIYGLHGRCQVTAIEKRRIGDETIEFYKLERQKSPLSRSQKATAAIWIPVVKAGKAGLRSPMNQGEAEEVLSLLGNREHFFPIDMPWSQFQSQLDFTIAREGSTGLAKAMSYLTVLKRRQVVPSAEVSRLLETVSRLLLKELDEALNPQGNRNIEQEVTKLLRAKLTRDH